MKPFDRLSTARHKFVIELPAWGAVRAGGVWGGRQGPSQGVSERSERKGGGLPTPLKYSSSSVDFENPFTTSGT